MPKRSESHMSERREQVLAAALRCFVRDGFHPTSMADVVAESGLSAGSVYRYFPSKHALIHACAEEVFTSVRPAIAELAERPVPAAPGDAVDVLIAAVLAAGEKRGLDLTRLVVMIWAESLRDPALADLLRDYYGQIRGHLATIIRAWRNEAGRGEVDIEPLSGVVLAMIPGFVLQRQVFGDAAVSHSDYVRALGQLVGSERVR